MTTIATAAAPRRAPGVVIPPPWIDPSHAYWSNAPMSREQTATVLIDASAAASKVSSLIDGLVDKPDLRARPEAWEAAARAEDALTTVLGLGRDSLLRHLPGEQHLDDSGHRTAYIATTLGIYGQEYARLGGKLNLVAQGLRQGIDASGLVLGKDVWHSLELRTGTLTQAAVNLLRNGKPARRATSVDGTASR